ncbi:hypothetical protein QBC44DRAFT_329091 [Cladorrhinum sp. PSN332]|nr:hypothetical protein QBC44DRAFT_329091 [Cladorrhinum sp. PSN332]
MSQFGRQIISKAGTPRMGTESARLRTIYLKVKPAPATLSERRAVLQMLKQHGDVQMFQRLIDASSFVSLAGTKIIADRIIARSPLTFKYNDDTNRNPTLTAPQKKEFLIHVYATENYFHKTQIRDSPLHGRWDIDPFDIWHPHTLSTNSLPQVVPPGMGHRGLTDWESCGQLEGLADPEERVMLNDKELFEVRQRRRETLAAMESLIEIWKENTEEGKKAAAELEKKGFGTASEKTKAKAFEVLERAAKGAEKEGDGWGRANF